MLRCRRIPLSCEIHSCAGQSEDASPTKKARGTKKSATGFIVRFMSCTGLDQCLVSCYFVYPSFCLSRPPALVISSDGYGKTIM